AAAGRRYARPPGIRAGGRCVCGGGDRRRSGAAPSGDTYDVMACGAACYADAAAVLARITRTPRGCPMNAFHRRPARGFATGLLVLLMALAAGPASGWHGGIDGDHDGMDDRDREDG